MISYLYNSRDVLYLGWVECTSQQDILYCIRLIVLCTYVAIVCDGLSVNPGFPEFSDGTCAPLIGFT